MSGVRSPRQTALLLGVSMSMLRKLTFSGEIGHVRLGTGELRQRFGYTEAQIAEFIAARSVPAASAATGTSTLGPVRPVRRRASKAAADVEVVATRALREALDSGAVTEWQGAR